MSERLNLRLLDVLTSLADELVAQLHADACSISRVIGDVLIMVAEHVHDGTTLQLGQGYLVPDYPQTAEVLATGAPRGLTPDDVDVDPAEAATPRDLGFAARGSAPSEGRSSTVSTSRRPACRRAMPSSSRSSSNGSMRTFESEPMHMPTPRCSTRSSGRNPSPRFDSVVGQTQIRDPA